MSNIPLHILDEYAKTLSYKQAKKLYECKTNSKYKKVIYKGTEYQNNNSFNICLTNNMLSEANMNVNNILMNYVAKHNLQYNLIKEGICLYTPLADNYMALLGHLMRDGISKKTLCENVDNSTKSFLTKLNS